MIARAKGRVHSVTDNKKNMAIVVSAEDKNQIKKFIASYNNSKDQNGMDVTIELQADLLGTAQGGKLFLDIKDSTIILEKAFRTHSRASQNTFLGILRFIAWADLGYKPTEEDMFWYIEGAVEKYAPEMLNPVTGKVQHLRLSDPRLTTRHMAIMIQHVLNELATKDIPEEVLNWVGTDMKKMWESWYSWRYSIKEDPLFDNDMNLTWEQYKEWYPVCEFTGTPQNDYDPLERMHIVTGGSSPGSYDESWNWIHALHSVHMRQHSETWEDILKDYPHMKGKVDRAREIAHKKGLDTSGKSAAEDGFVQEDLGLF